MEVEYRQGKRKRLEDRSTAADVLKSVIVCGVCREQDGFLIEGKKFYERHEFFKIDDIKDGSTELSNCFEPLMSCFYKASVFTVDSCFYLMGTYYYTNDPPVPASIPNEFTGQLVSCNEGLSYVDFDQHDPAKSSSWVSCGKILNFGNFVPIALGGKIYALSRILTDEIIVFDPMTAKWSALHARLPPLIHKHHLAGKLIADHANGRILVCLRSSQLYAWYPEDGSVSYRSWFCLDPSMDDFCWDRYNPTLADHGLIFFSFYHCPELFRVYEIDAKQWVQVEWLVLCPRFPFDVGQVASLFYLGDCKLCLAFSLLLGDLAHMDDYGSQITLVVFEYAKTSTTASHSTINMSYLYHKKFYARGIVKPIEFIPIA